MEPIVPSHLKNKYSLGWWDSLAGEGIYCSAFQSEFDPWDSCGGKKTGFWKFSTCTYTEFF